MTRRRLFLLAAIIVTAGGFFTFWLFQGPAIVDRDLTGLEGDVGRGAYIARLTGCIACHTNIKAGGKVLAGGAPIVTEFGSFYPPNITPHESDGIGTWDLDDFTRALTGGKSPQGHAYYPSFPYAFYTRLEDQDIVDLWAAVKSVPAVAGGPPEHDLNFPFNLRLPLGAWQRLFLKQGKQPDLPDRDAKWLRGRYLAEATGHCGACHTPRNLFGARKTDEQYQGGLAPEGKKVPAITRVALEKAGWTERDLAYALKTGILPDGDAFGGAMTEVVQAGTRFWTPEDLEAIAAYIFSPPDEN
ncbi:c-type cytochrome [Aestuariispira insulae]|uniref:Mono/diheme cytochrome c family protein n=1 Tax=Aestuariispira insulae TaxID=1461337 RepID=A0A3D9HQ36_9PROT|nr:cytochrome c [Aestuariispira insulae]RED51607.1 mono/diheme cytochrome c family protein [Aestuariispira insulae]